VKKGTLYYEKACALVSGDAAASKDAHVQAQLLLTQGLLFFASEQVRRSCYASYLLCSAVFDIILQLLAEDDLFRGWLPPTSCGLCSGIITLLSLA
jgi:hypothetical protein